jgi:NitT/TauT family transport system substrate-binding protein
VFVRFRNAVAGLTIAMLAAACGPAVSSHQPAGSSCGVLPASAGPSATLVNGCGAATSLTVGLGYIPSVQFAPFYLAQQDGYYANAGLSVTFQNKIDPDLVALTGQGAIDIGIADGTDVIPAVSQHIPIRYVATLYGTFPNVVFAKASSGIASAADLKGRKIGTPGRYGSSWVMLQALLGSAQLGVDDVKVVEYPDFGQGVAVSQGAVDAATGFTNNEPVQLELAGTKAIELHVDQVLGLPGPGLIVGSKALASKAAAVRAFVVATLQAMAAIRANPEQGLDASIAAVPELATNRATQLAILTATIATWSRPGAAGGAPFGSIDKAGWQASIDYMTKLGLVAQPVTVDQVLSTDYLPPGVASPSP